MPITGLHPGHESTAPVGAPNVPSTVRRTANASSGLRAGPDAEHPENFGEVVSDGDGRVRPELAGVRAEPNQALALAARDDLAFVGRTARRTTRPSVREWPTARRHFSHRFLAAESPRSREISIGRSIAGRRRWENMWRPSPRGRNGELAGYAVETEAFIKVRQR